MIRTLATLCLLLPAVFGSMHTLGARRTPKWNAPVETRRYELRDFSRIAVTAATYVTVEQGATFAVEAESSRAGLLDILDVTVTEQTLHIDYQSGFGGSFYNYPELRLRVVLPRIDELQQGGSGDLVAEKPLSTEHLLVALLSSGEIRLSTVECVQGLEARITGSGDLLLETLAAASSLRVESVGSGSVMIKAANLRGGASLSVGGSGDATVRSLVCQGLELGITGSGTISLGKTSLEGGLNATILGSGDMDITEISAKGDVSIAATGSCDVSITELQAEAVNLMLGGTGEIMVQKGRATRGDFRLSSTGDIMAEGLALEHATVELTGSGEVMLQATQTLMIKQMRGGGSISYRGKPRVEMQEGGDTDMIRQIR